MPKSTSAIPNGATIKNPTCGMKGPNLREPTPKAMIRRPMNAMTFPVLRLICSFYPPAAILAGVVQRPRHLGWNLVALGVVTAGVAVLMGPCIYGPSTGQVIGAVSVGALLVVVGCRLIRSARPPAR